MSQSRSPSDTEQPHSPPTILLKEAANGTPVADDQCPNLDDEVSAARGVDLAIPQKREREASLEPPTPHPDDTANEPASENNRSQSPVKKSRALSTPVEADENDNEYDFVDALDGEVPVPSPRPSPPQETKVRQESQDTDDIDACNGQQSAQGHGDTAATPAVPDNVTPPDVQAQTGIPSPTHVATNTEPQNQLEIVKVSATGEVDAKAPTGETNVPASVEPAATSPVTEEPNLPVAASTKHISPSEAQRPPEIDNQNQPNSHADTGTGAGSNTRETKRPTPPLSEVDGATKRPREDEDGDLDPNPREAKRASPPPEKEKEKEKEKKEKSTRKKSGSDARAPSAPASPRSKPVSVFGGGGFASYASMESPFASLKGPSLFSSSTTLTKSSTITITNTIPTPPTTSNAAPPLTISSSLPNSPPKTVPNSPVQRTASPTPAKRTGFEAFASAASPFVSAAARTRSPVRRSGSPGPGAGARSNPFAIYAAGGSQSLFSATGAPAAKRARGDSESIAPGECSESGSWREGSVGDEKSFGERLRAGSGSGGDDEDEADGGVWGEQTTGGKWAEQEVLTGEEEDETIHSVRGKLYILSEQNQWKERGSGLLRLNRRRVDRGGARLVMRKDAVFVVLLNVTLFRGMSCAIAQDPRYLRFSVLAPDGTIHYNLRVGSAQAAVDLLKAINDNIPRT